MMRKSITYILKLIICVILKINLGTCLRILNTNSNTCNNNIQQYNYYHVSINYTHIYNETT